MARYILRRLGQAFFTLLGVMLITFLLFNVIAGDISSQFLGPRANPAQRQAFLQKHKLDLPILLNLNRRLELIDQTKGENPPKLVDAADANIIKALSLALQPANADAPLMFVGRWVSLLHNSTPLETLTQGKSFILPLKTSTTPTSLAATQPTPQAIMKCSLSDGSSFEVNLTETATAGDVLQKINTAPGNDGKLLARISHLPFTQIFDSQFFWHMRGCVTFEGKSFETNQTLLEIIGEKARYSLAIQIPALALGWLLAMVISCTVAYYRGRWIDHVGVFLSVLGMCIPYLAYMILGQWVMFRVYPQAAYGLRYPANVYVPVAIAVIAGLGGSVRFYRTVILNEIHQDYVRTARAKGMPMPDILFKHVLKNCMLPILTSLVMTIPFLIMGSLLLEKFFGVPGLGNLMISSIQQRDMPIIAGLTFLTAVIYIIGLLVTDILYAVFDPRIRLQ